MRIFPVVDGDVADGARLCRAYPPYGLLIEWDSEEVFHLNARVRGRSVLSRIKAMPKDAL
jgi:hypothetical protein